MRGTVKPDMWKRGRAGSRDQWRATSSNKRIMRRIDRAVATRELRQEVLER